MLKYSVLWVQSSDSFSSKVRKRIKGRQRFNLSTMRLATRPGSVQHRLKMLLTLTVAKGSSDVCEYVYDMIMFSRVMEDYLGS